MTVGAAFDKRGTPIAIYVVYISPVHIMKKVIYTWIFLLFYPELSALAMLAISPTLAASNTTTYSKQSGGH